MKIKFYPNEGGIFDEKNILSSRKLLALSEYVFTFPEIFSHNQDILKTTNALQRKTPLMFFCLSWL